MSATDITLISVFGSLGYLAIGWVTMVVSAAKWPTHRKIYDAHTGGYKKDDTQLAEIGYGWFVLLWPAILPALIVLGVCWVLFMAGEAVFDKGALAAVKRLNPEIEEWS